MRADLLTKFLCDEVGTPFETWKNRKNVFISFNGKIYDIGRCIPVSDDNFIFLECGDDITSEFIEEQKMKEHKIINDNETEITVNELGNVTDVSLNISPSELYHDVIDDFSDLYNKNEITDDVKKKYNEIARIATEHVKTLPDEIKNNTEITEKIKECILSMDDSKIKEIFDKVDESKNYDEDYVNVRREGIDRIRKIIKELKG